MSTPLHDDLLKLETVCQQVATEAAELGVTEGGPLGTLALMVATLAVRVAIVSISIRELTTTP